MMLMMGNDQALSACQITKGDVLWIRESLGKLLAGAATPFAFGEATKDRTNERVATLWKFHRSLEQLIEAFSECHDASKAAINKGRRLDVPEFNAVQLAWEKILRPHRELQAAADGTPLREEQQQHIRSLEEQYKNLQEAIENSVALNLIPQRLASYKTTLIKLKVSVSQDISVETSRLSTTSSV